jgi:hypothetical protein
MGHINFWSMMMMMMMTMMIYLAKNTEDLLDPIKEVGIEANVMSP